MNRALVCLFVVAGCGGDDASTGAVTASTAEPYCEQGCQRDVACDGSTSLQECVDDCIGGVAGWAREDVLADLSACHEALSCTATDDECPLVCAPTATHAAYEAACRDALGACEVDADSLDQICETSPEQSLGGDGGLVCVIAPSIVEELTACFTAADVGCTTYEPCLSDVFDAHGIDF